MNDGLDNSNVDISLEIMNRSKVDEVRILMSELSSSNRDLISNEFACGMRRQSNSIIKSIKEIVHYRASNISDHEAVRSIIIGACCGPLVDLKTLSNELEIYGNRNYLKLDMYRKRRDAYLRGEITTLAGVRYSSSSYGFTEDVLNYLRNWYVDDECSTPDRCGRKVDHVDCTEARVTKVVRHMKAGDHQENHDPFVEFRRMTCLELCARSFRDAERTMQPRIPSRAVLEACRPSYVKYFKRYEFGECSACINQLITTSAC